MRKSLPVTNIKFKLLQPAGMHENQAKYPLSAQTVAFFFIYYLYQAHDILVSASVSGQQNDNR